MIVADPLVTDAEVCGACAKVRPARSIRQCTRARADEILARGYCMCPQIAQEAPGGLAALSDETREIYRDLVEMSQELPVTMTEPVSFDDGSQEPLTVVDMVPVDESEDVWEEAPPEAPETALAVPDKPAPTPRQQKRGKKPRRQRKTVKVVQLKPVTDPSSAEPVWTHPAETPVAGPSSIPVIDGGGVVTGPQQIPPPQEE